MTNAVIPGGSPLVDDPADQPFATRKPLGWTRQMDLADGLGLVRSWWKRGHATR